MAETSIGPFLARNTANARFLTVKPGASRRRQGEETSLSTALQCFSPGYRGAQRSLPPPPRPTPIRAPTEAQRRERVQRPSRTHPPSPAPMSWPLTRTRGRSVSDGAVPRPRTTLTVHSPAASFGPADTTAPGSRAPLRARALEPTPTHPNPPRRAQPLITPTARDTPASPARPQSHRARAPHCGRGRLNQPRHTPTRHGEPNPSLRRLRKEALTLPGARYQPKP